MLDYRDQIQSIYEFIKRSEVEQKYPYAYEIYLLTGIDETALTSRTAGTEKFNGDIESAIEKAKQAHGTLRVVVYGGKSHNAKHINDYTVNVSGLLNPPKEPIERAEIHTIIKEEMKQHQIQNSTDGLGEINGLLGLLTGENEQAKSKVEGLFGLFNALSGNNKEVERINYQKQLDDFKFETRYTSLEEKYERLRNENAELRAEKDRYQNENKELKTEKTDLESRLAGYAPNEVMKRVATGTLVGIGSRILTNSPKTAELLGLTAEELKGALGMVDDSPEETATIPDTNVEITDMGAANSPEDKKKAEIIKNLSDALMTWELQDVAKIANIVGVCLDKAELINKTLIFLNQSMNGTAETGNTDLDNQDLDND